MRQEVVEGEGVDAADGADDEGVGEGDGGCEGGDVVGGEVGGGWVEGAGDEGYLGFGGIHGGVVEWSHWICMYACNGTRIKFKKRES